MDTGPTTWEPGIEGDEEVSPPSTPVLDADTTSDDSVLPGGLLDVDFEPTQSTDPFALWRAGYD